MFWFFYLLIFVAVALGVGAVLTVWWCVWIAKRKKFLEKRAAINATLMQTAEKNGLQIDKVFVVNDYLSRNKQNKEIKPQFLIDTTARKMILVDYDKSLVTVVGFEEFLNYEIYENGSMAFSGGAVGGALVGGFWGETTGKCNNLRLIVRLKKYDCPQIAYDIIAKTPLNMGVTKTWKEYQTCVSSMQELASFFEILKSETVSPKQ